MSYKYYIMARFCMSRTVPTGLYVCLLNKLMLPLVQSKCKLWSKRERVCVGVCARMCGWVGVYTIVWPPQYRMHAPHFFSSLPHHLQVAHERFDYFQPMKDFTISMCQEQTGFWAGRSTMEQIFSCRVLVEKRLRHQRDLFHNFIDFKKAFKRVWHDGLWHVLRSFKGSFRSSRPSMNTPAALFSSATSWENYSKQQLASGRDACSPQYYSTCSWKKKKICRTPSRTTTPPSPLVAGHSATPGLQMTLSLWEALSMNSRSHEQTRCQRVPMAWKSAQDMSKDMLNSTNEISVNITMNGESLKKWPSSSAWEPPCQKMAPAEQKSGSPRPQQRWPGWTGCGKATSASKPNSSSSDRCLSPSCSTDVRHGLCWWMTRENPGIRDQVPEETSPYLVQRAQDQWLCTELGQEPRGSSRTSPGNRQATEAGVVWPRHEAALHPL